MDDSSDGGSGIGAVVAILVMLILMVGFIGLIFWVHNDSKRNQVAVFISRPFSPDDPKIWTFVCFICCVLGVPYYLYRRSEVTGKQSLAPATSTEEQLKQALDLKEKGLITESEFEQKRRKIIGL